MAELDLQTAAADLTHTAAVQTVLTVTGFWRGPIDGVWTEELTAALQAFQTALGVEPTGVVDAATLAVFQQARDELQAPAAPATTGAPTTTLPTTPAPPAPDTTTTSPVPAPGGEATVLLADSDLGPILTAANGMTVYLFTPDAQGAPTCVDSCADFWPPLIIDDASPPTAGAGLDAPLGTTEHPDAGTQVTYNGWPLYLFAGDLAAGDTNGQGQEGVWYVLDAAGDAIGAD